MRFLSASAAASILRENSPGSRRPVIRRPVSSTRACRITGGISMVCGMLNDSLAPAIMAAVSLIRAEYAESGTPRTATGASVCRTNASAREREVRNLRKSTVSRSRSLSPVLKTKKQSLPVCTVDGSATPSANTGKFMVPTSKPSGILPTSR